MTKELKGIILAKCDECERNGFWYLNDSDIMDILEECERRNIPVTRKEIEQLGMK
jgi:muramoyltetrapeptide carboxypeptidase LdcA involved in peptidoglycan recycling